MQIKQIYEQYQIMPQLATHMLRVAGIGKLITDEWEDRKLAKTCITACLLHDMGNMAKFNLTNPITPIVDLTMWQERQKEFWQKYGHEAHEATYAILREAGLETYIPYLEEEGEMYAHDPALSDFQHASRPSIIVLYADLRVSIPGVVSLGERIADLTKRYGGVRPESRWGKELEDYVQTLTKVEIRKITETDVEPLFDEMLEYSVI